MTSAERTKAFRDKARAKGKCIQCYTRKQKPGSSRCATCMIQRRKSDSLAVRRAAARKAGLCGTCCLRKPEDGAATCLVCREGGQRSAPPAAGPFCLQCLAFHPRGMHRLERRLLW